MGLAIINSTMCLALAQMPVPRDIDLPLPIGDWQLKLLLVVLFLVHILFVNLMVGGSVLAVVFELLGLKRPKFDSLAKRIAETITVNKSLAVVLGVGPLLCINLVYTIHFYSANALTGYAWISIVPLVIVAFLLTYLHKYTWDKWRGPYKNLHVIVGAAAAFLFLCVPLIFLANINLMLFPAKWVEVEGFFSSLRVGNVFPRYFHFLAASLAITGLFLAGWFGRKGYPAESNLPDFTGGELKGLFYRTAFFVTLAQLAFGPLLLFTLPYEGISGLLFAAILPGVAVALVLLYVLRREIRADRDRLGLAYLGICLLFTAIVVAMATGRHVYREASLAEHKTMIEDETARFRSIEYATHMSIDAGYGVGETLGAALTGEKVFRNCAACHAVNRVLAAPSLVEVSTLYQDNPEGIVSWAKAPGKKRAEFAPMPSFAHLGEDQLRLVAEYILKTGQTARDNPD